MIVSRGFIEYKILYRVARLTLQAQTVKDSIALVEGLSSRGMGGWVVIIC
jgi:hypothetical protein